MPRAAAEFSYFQKLCFCKRVERAKNWNFQLDLDSEVVVLLYFITGFQNRNWKVKRELNNIALIRLSTSHAQCTVS